MAKAPKLAGVFGQLSAQSCWKSTSEDVSSGSLIVDECPRPDRPFLLPRGDDALRDDPLPQLRLQYFLRE